MTMGPGAKEGPAERLWFPPFRLLVLVCSLTVLVYFDRGSIATNGVNGSKPRKGKPGTGIQARRGGTFHLCAMNPLDFEECSYFDSSHASASCAGGVWSEHAGGWALGDFLGGARQGSMMLGWWKRFALMGPS